MPLSSWVVKRDSGRLVIVVISDVVFFFVFFCLWPFQSHSDMIPEMDVFHTLDKVRAVLAHVKQM